MFTLGFLHYAIGKGGNDIVSFTNYGDVGFSMDNGHRDGAINASWSLGHPKLRACLHKRLGHFAWLIVRLVSALHSGWRRLPS